MRRLILIAAASLAACQPGIPDPAHHVLVDSPLWPGQHEMRAEEVCEGSEDVPACVREVETERVRAGRPAETQPPR